MRLSATTFVTFCQLRSLGCGVLREHLQVVRRIDLAALLLVPEVVACGAPGSEQRALHRLFVFLLGELVQPEANGRHQAVVRLEDFANGVVANVRIRIDDAREALVHLFQLLGLVRRQARAGLALGSSGKRRAPLPASAAAALPLAAGLSSAARDAHLNEQQRAREQGPELSP